MCLTAQERTVGVLEVAPEAYERVQIIPSLDQPYAALINLCGEVLQEWDLDYLGRTAHFLSDGRLLVSGRIDDGTFGRPGKTGALQIRSWDNQLLWETTFTAGRYGAHHDVLVTPEETIFVLVWERIDSSQAIQAGRDTGTVASDIWPEAILEIDPVGSDTFDIVWEWHAWDHLIQDRDSSLANFGVISEHPERFDVNRRTRFDDDWMHANSLSYDPIKDEIIINSRDWNEFWIIDHSTTSAEARGSTGGRSGRGGDLLYRWGNPMNYGRGDSTDQRLYAQHDATFNPDRSDTEGLIISAFNNNSGIAAPSEAVELIVPLSDGDYPKLVGDDSYAPDDFIFRYSGDPEGVFDSRVMGSYERLPNGNILTTTSLRGEYYEFTPEGDLAWHYRNPINLFGIAAQGDTVNGRVFHAYPYELDDPVFDGRDLRPIRETLESDSEGLCDCPFSLIVSTSTIPAVDDDMSITILASKEIEIRFDTKESRSIVIYSLEGQEVYRQVHEDQRVAVPLGILPTGMYAVGATSQSGLQSKLFFIH
ncbi:MAG: arylsulfotransferase family protein [Bacteroidota bacterium]